MQIVGSKIRITFAPVDNGIVSKGSRIEGFSVAGRDKVFYWAEAKIDNDKQAVWVWNADVPKPVAVRYGWADNPECNLYSKADLPVAPFRTDYWKCLMLHYDFLTDWTHSNSPVKPCGQIASHWLAKAYFAKSALPDVVVLGDSQLGPLLGADAYVYDRSVDIAGDRRSLTTEHDVKLLLHKNWRVFIAALPDAMISDQLIISRALFSRAHKQKPSLVIIGLAPREFIDNTGQRLTATEPFAFFAKSINLGRDACLFSPNCTSQITKQYKDCLSSPLTLGQPFQLIRPGEMIIGSGDGNQFNNNTDGYKVKYNDPRGPQLAVQLRCLDALFRYLKQQHIAAVAIELPLTNANHIRLPESCWKCYNQKITDICHKNDVDYWDTELVWDDFREPNFVILLT